MLVQNKNHPRQHYAEQGAQYAKQILPPFGRDVIQVIKPYHREIFVFIDSKTKAFEKAKLRFWNGGLALAYLPWEPPTKFKWPVAQKELLIFNSLKVDLPDTQLQLLADCLLRAGATVVRYIHLNKKCHLRIFNGNGGGHDEKN